MWDVWIHILGIGAECACWGWGQSCRGPLIRLAFARHLPLKGKASGRPGVPPLRSEGDLYEGRVRTPAPTADGVWAKTRAHTVRPYTIIINGSAYKKRDRFRTCPLKPRGEAKLRTKFLCLLSFSKKVRGSGGEPEPLTCVCCKGEGEMGDIDFFWVRSYHNRKIRQNRVRIMNFL